jgi:hypothetical protein
MARILWAIRSPRVSKFWAPFRVLAGLPRSLNIGKSFGPWLGALLEAAKSDRIGGAQGADQPGALLRGGLLPGGAKLERLVSHTTRFGCLDRSIECSTQFYQKQRER